MAAHAATTSRSLSLKLTIFNGNLTVDAVASVSRTALKTGSAIATTAPALEGKSSP